MPIFNTPRLAQVDVDTMNISLRNIGLVGGGGLITDYEINGDPAPPAGTRDPMGRNKGLAEYFNVKPLTVKSWLVQPGQYPRYRRCVPQRDFFSQSVKKLIPGAIGRRIYCLQPSQLLGPTDPLNNLRQRIFLCAALGVRDPNGGGLQRVPITTGKARTKVIPATMLSGALEEIRTIWTEEGSEWAGNDTYFLERAWNRFTIEGTPGNWRVIVRYNDKFTVAELYNQEFEDETQNNGLLEGCP